jgi:hypothetical protein
MTTTLRRLLLPILLLTALSLRAQTLVTFTFSGTMNTADTGGYKNGSALTFSFTLSSASTPAGDWNNPYIDWIRSDNTTSLFSSFSGTGLAGKWTGTDSTAAATDDEIVINTAFSPSVLAFQTNSVSGNLLLTSPDGSPVSGLYLQGQWSGLNLPDVNITDPVSYFANNYTGTYSLFPGSNSSVLYFATGPSMTLQLSSLTISATAIPEPSATAVVAGLGAISLAFLRRRRSAA